jgi:hypothetical protein
MRTFNRKTLFAVFLTIACLGVAGANPAAGQDKPGPREERRKQRAVEEKCSDYKRRYEDAKKGVQQARRGQLEDALKKQDAALKDYCECLRYWFEDAGLPIPQKYEQLCNPKPPEDPGIPEEFRSTPGTPDTQVMPGEPEPAADPCAKLRYDIKTLEELEEHFRKNNEKLPEPSKKKLERLRKELAQCENPGGLAVPGGENSTIGKQPQVPLPDKGQKPGTGSTGTAPNPPPGGGAYSPAPPGSQASGSGWLDAFFRGRMSQQIKAATKFERHNTTNCAKHCNLCRDVRNGVTLRVERAPGDPNGVLVTLLEPPVPTIECRAKAEGGFDCGGVTGAFCQLSPQVEIPHMKLDETGVSDLGLRFVYPEDTLDICVNGRTAP